MTARASSPAMVALERARAAWEKAGRPGPAAKQLVLPRLASPSPSDFDRMQRSGR